jgi:hypothetical protein
MQLFWRGDVGNKKRLLPQQPASDSSNRDVFDGDQLQADKQVSGFVRVQKSGVFDCYQLPSPDGLSGFGPVQRATEIEVRKMPWLDRSIGFIEIHPADSCDLGLPGQNQGAAEHGFDLKRASTREEANPVRFIR